MYNRTQRENVETGTNAKKMNVVYGSVVRVDIASDDHKRDIDAGLFSCLVLEIVLVTKGSRVPATRQQDGALRNTNANV